MDRDWTRPIDAYCERLTPDFWAEPLNAVTNAAFIIAAIAALLLARRMGRLEGPVALCTALLFCIGVGSFLFHTFALSWAALADTLPIGLFILAYLYAAARRFFRASVPLALAALPAFIAAAAAFSKTLGPAIFDLIGSSVGYAPPLLLLCGVSAALAARRHPAAGGVALAAGLFIVSLTFRALDGPLCDQVAFGTHFLWHVFNAILLYILLATLIRHGPRLEAAPARG